jgi:hypothetical protein
LCDINFPEVLAQSINEKSRKQLSTCGSVTASPKISSQNYKLPILINDNNNDLFINTTKTTCDMEEELKLSPELTSNDEINSIYRELGNSNDRLIQLTPTKLNQHYQMNEIDENISLEDDDIRFLADTFSVHAATTLFCNGSDAIEIINVDGESENNRILKETMLQMSNFNSNNIENNEINYNDNDNKDKNNDYFDFTLSSDDDNDDDNDNDNTKDDNNTKNKDKSNEKTNKNGIFKTIPRVAASDTERNQIINEIIEKKLNGAQIKCFQSKNSNSRITYMRNTTPTTTPKQQQQTNKDKI